MKEIQSNIFEVDADAITPPCPGHRWDTTSLTDTGWICLVCGSTDGPQRQTLHVWTDGACSGNPGPGGWAWLAVFNGKEKVVSGYSPETTNIQMELIALLECIKAINKEKIPAGMTMHVHHDYTGVAKWFNGEWKRKDPKVIAICSEIDRLKSYKGITLEFVHVKGHLKKTDPNYDANNEKVDTMAVAAYKEKM